MLGVGTHHSTILLYDFRLSGQEVCRVVYNDEANYGNSVSDIAFGSNGFYIASCDFSGIRLWDLRKLRCMCFKKTSSSAVCSRFDFSSQILTVLSSSIEVYSTAGNLGLHQRYAYEREGSGKTICYGKNSNFALISSGSIDLKLVNFQ